ncbi:hypothetical protein MKW98_008022 [Papaver atlanticum]|uniref:Uncharacterized protein n=1 Tax=Papaver atlanticum TaxID=357466 RepID=A0AAD4XM65_9MAGN|nr:hypothetical protein MKW98_008022 [Papaver atlanticum]
MVYILFNGGGDIHEALDILIYCHPGEKEWRKHEFVNRGDYRVGGRSLEKMVYVKGKLYIRRMNGDDLEIEVQHGSDIGDEETLGIREFGSTYESSKYEKVEGSLGCCMIRHWLGSSDEIFNIGKRYIPRDKSMGTGIAHRYIPVACSF